MNRFRVWVPDDGDRPEDFNVTTLDAATAAEEFVERNEANLDHPAEVLVRVDDAFGNGFEFVVNRVKTISFSARVAGSWVTCPRCSRTSHHPTDVKERYCGACHAWFP